MAKVEQDIEVEIDIPKSLKFKKTIGKIKYKLHEEEVKLIVDIKKIEKEIERLQEQLNDANEAIKTIRKTVKEGEFPCDACGYSMACDGCWCGDIADDYLEKWGVK